MSAFRIALLACLTCTGALHAQGVRINTATTAQLVVLRPLAEDSVPASQTTGTGLLRTGPDGVRVHCSGGATYCRYRRATDERITAVPFLQDVEATGWGLTTGFMAYTQLRFRAHAGSAGAVWPRADDAFDALAAYVELDRERLRARAGRQYRASGLGYFNFDGLAVLARPLTGVGLELYGGRSLVEGLNEPVTSADLAAVEPFAPDTRAWVLGAEARYRADPLALAATYQREIRTDRAALYSERVSADARLRLPPAELEARVQHDVATGDLNDLTLRIRAARLARFARLSAQVEARHYRPYFDLWTIWGVFSPTGFDEASVLLGATGTRGSVRVRAAYRDYRDTDAGISFGPMRTTGWTATLDGDWRAGSEWNVAARYSADINFGAAGSEADISVRRALGSSSHVALTGTAFQNVLEFRIENGTVFGAGAEAGLALGGSARLTARVHAYRHSEAERRAVDWTQLRGYARMDWMMGRDPGQPE